MRQFILVHTYIWWLTEDGFLPSNWTCHSARRLEYKSNSQHERNFAQI